MVFQQLTHILKVSALWRNHFQKFFEAEKLFLTYTGPLLILGAKIGDLFFHHPNFQSNSSVVLANLLILGAKIGDLFFHHPNFQSKPFLGACNFTDLGC